MKRIVKLASYVLFVLATMSFSAFASTAVEYGGECQYFDSHKELRYQGHCLVNWGVGKSDNGYYERYVVTYPNGSQI